MTDRTLASFAAAGDAEKLPDLLPGLVDFALGPYLGAERAGELADESAGGPGP